MLHISSDHAGFKAKEKLKKYLTSKEIIFIDHGPKTLKSKDDYPEYAHLLANIVSLVPTDKGILICGSGFGMAISANKTKNIRAATLHSTKEARLAREHNDLNIACLSSKLQTQKDHQKIIDTFLKTEFTKDTRHKRRIKKIEI
jgi:ribose 5-phosphate isomerase B